MTFSPPYTRPEPLTLAERVFIDAHADELNAILYYIADCIAGITDNSHTCGALAIADLCRFYWHLALTFYEVK